MEKVIETFMREAEKARDWQALLRYQWVLNAAEGTELDLLDALLIAKCKGN